MKLLVSILFFIASIGISELVCAAPAYGIFMVVKGKVKVIDSTNKESLAKVGTKIFVGDTAVSETDSRAKIVMQDRNVIHISPNTKLKIETYTVEANSKNVKLSLLEGKVRNNVEQKYDNDKNKFQIQTPTAVAGVRGTQFITSYSVIEKKTEVITLRGTVELRKFDSATNSTSTEAVTVEKGEKSSTSEASAAPEPPEKVPTESLKEIEKESSVKKNDPPPTEVNRPKPPPPPTGNPPPPQVPPKSPLIDGRIENKNDKTKIKVVPVPPTTNQ